MKKSIGYLCFVLTILGFKCEIQRDTIITLYCESGFKGTRLAIDSLHLTHDECYEMSNLFPTCDVRSMELNQRYCAFLFRASCDDARTEKVTNRSIWLDDIHNSPLANVGAIKIIQCMEAELDTCTNQLLDCTNSKQSLTYHNANLKQQLADNNNKTVFLNQELDACQQNLEKSNCTERLNSCYNKTTLLETNFHKLKLQTDNCSNSLDNCQNQLHNLQNQFTFFKNQTYLTQNELKAYKHEIVNLTTTLAITLLKADKAEKLAVDFKKHYENALKLVDKLQKQMETLEKNVTNSTEHLQLYQQLFTVATTNLTTCYNRTQILTSQIIQYENTSLKLKTQLANCKAQAIEIQNQLNTSICETKKNYTVLVCQTLTGELQCPNQEKIQIIIAFYGRNDKIICGRENAFDVHCSSPTAQTVISNRCNGKNSCEITANNDTFGNPCIGTRKYLTVTYNCAN